MSRPIIYSSVGVAVVAIIIFTFLGNGSSNRVVTSQDKTKENGITSTAAAAPAMNVAPIDIKIKNLVVNKTNDKKTASIKTAFEVHNPNTNTMILDGIRYNVYVDNVLMTSGTIGTEAPEDVMRSQQGFPIIGNSIVILRDTQTIQENRINPASWNKILGGDAAKASYAINGTYSFRQTANLEASGGVQEFSLRFP